MDEFCPSNVDLELEVMRIARRQGVFTVDDLHGLDESVEWLGRKRQVYGAVLRSLERQGVIRKVGYVNSIRRTCHYRPVLVWEYVGGCVVASR